MGSIPWVRKIPWRRECQPIPVFLPRESPDKTEEPSELQSMGSQRVRHSWATEDPTPTASKGVMSPVSISYSLVGSCWKSSLASFSVASPHPGHYLQLTLLSFTISTYLSRFYPPEVSLVANSQSKMWSHNLIFAPHFFTEVQMFSLVQTRMMQRIFILRGKKKTKQKRRQICQDIHSTYEGGRYWWFNLLWIF